MLVTEVVWADFDILFRELTEVEIPEGRVQVWSYFNSYRCTREVGVISINGGSFVPERLGVGVSPEDFR